MMYEREFQLSLLFDNELASFVVMDVAEVDPLWRGSELNIRPNASVRELSGSFRCPRCGHDYASSTSESFLDAYSGSTGIIQGHKFT